MKKKNPTKYKEWNAKEYTHVLFYDLTRKCCSIGWYYSSWIDSRIDSEATSIANDSSEFLSSAIDKFIFHFDSNICMVMPEIGYFWSSTNIDIISDHRISKIRQMRYSWVITKIGIFAFDERSDFWFGSYTWIPSDIAIWSDYCIFSKISISFDICSRLEYDTFFEIDISFYCHIWFDGRSLIDTFYIVAYDEIISIQEIPWIAYRNPLANSFDDTISTVFNIDLDEISNLELSSGREWNIPKEEKNTTIKLMYSYIRKISEGRIRWFLHYSCGFSGIISCEYSKILWIIDGLTESSMSFYLCKIQYIFSIVEIISGYDDKTSCNSSLKW